MLGIVTRVIFRTVALAIAALILIFSAGWVFRTVKLHLPNDEVRTLSVTLVIEAYGAPTI
ncbi:hypothetical protein N9W17_04900 [Jannaschia sp.]|nr:hypothetical protein [Jannaschia sp.]